MMQEIEIDAAGLRFPALADGPEDGDLLLLLHGLPRNRWEWHHQIPSFGQLGFRVVAPDLRGFCPGARPDAVEQYHLGHYAADAVAIADAIGRPDEPFHLMGTSIGSTIAWWLAGNQPERIRTLVCINIPHPGAFLTAASRPQFDDSDAKAPDVAADQAERMDYIAEAQKEGRERWMFERMLEAQGVPDHESEPYRRALDDDDILRTVYHYYRAIPLWIREPIPPAAMPTMFIWPPGSENVTRSVAEATAEHVTGPYRFEIVEDVHQPVLQAAPATLTPLLVDHLNTHAL
jgi:pimeloyl-ACP methyl ester carboxylesterase